MAAVLQGCSGGGGAAVDPASSGAAPGERPPNVLFIVTDDQRAGGGSMKVMPATVRRLARRGINYKKAYISLPTCCPSRATLMTGQYAHNHGVINNEVGKNLDHSTTLQAALKDAGYHTAIFGKFINKWRADPPHFDRWMTFANQGGGTYTDPTFRNQGKLKKFTGYSTDILRKKAVSHLEWLEKKKDGKPWLMIMTPAAPHYPYTPAPRHRGKDVPKWTKNPAVREKDRSDKPDYVRARSATKKQVRVTRRMQLRSTMAVDFMVKQLDKKLGDLNERKNTLVIFLSDNGYSWGEHGLIGPRFSKNTPYTSSIKVPMFLRWPKKVTPRKSRRMVTNVDLVPTVYDAANVTPPITMDGRSLLKTGWKRNMVFLEHFHNPHAGEVPAWSSIVTKRYQYVENYADDTGAVITDSEFYRLKKDPWQLRNLLGDKNPLNDPDITDDHLLVTRLRKCRGTSGANPCP